MNYDDEVITMNRSNTTVPNPSCCSNPRTMCMRCAAQALAINEKEPSAGAGRWLTNNATASQANRSDFDRTDILPIPTINWTEERQTKKPQRQPEIIRPGVMANGGNPSMIPPVINWGA
jgi:hypothetical protein